MYEQILKFFGLNGPCHIIARSTHPLLLASYFCLIGSFQVAADVKEVLDTFRVAAGLGSDSFGAYVISMASNVKLC